jgi:hypothetical protein
LRYFFSLKLVRTAPRFEKTARYPSVSTTISRSGTPEVFRAGGTFLGVDGDGTAWEERVEAASGEGADPSGAASAGTPALGGVGGKRMEFNQREPNRIPMATTMKRIWRR